ncbi:hypothetical protein CRUP_032771 [Coryphaenoides rupestris]|nr:hypothetical protein CRUP_032771 [Coryphaenoides rupestris]
MFQKCKRSTGVWWVEVWWRSGGGLVEVWRRAVAPFQQQSSEQHNKQETTATKTTASRTPRPIRMKGMFTTTFCLTMTARSFFTDSPEPRQFPAGTQKPALSGFRVWLANTWLGGTKRYAGMPFTVTSST